MTKNTKFNLRLYNIISGIALILWGCTERLYIVDNLQEGYSIVCKMVLTDCGSAWIGVALFALMIIIAIDSLTNLVVGVFKLTGNNFREKFLFNQYYYILANILTLIITVFFIKINPRSLFTQEMIKPHASDLLKDYWVVMAISITIIAVNIIVLSKDYHRKSTVFAGISAVILIIFTPLPILSSYCYFPTAAYTKIKSLLGEDKINGIYLTRHSLIAEHSEENTVPELPSGKNVYQMLVPTAFGIYQDECDIYDILPNQRQILSQFNQGRSSEVNIIDIWDTLNARKSENIYCKTEDVWTKYGAYLAYRKAAEQMGFTPITLSGFNISHLETYNGSLSKKTADYTLIDTLRKYIPKNPREKSDNLLIVGDKYCENIIPFFENHYLTVSFVNILDIKEDFELDNYQQTLLLFAI